MAKIICRGWRKEPDEGSQQAYEVFTGRKKPFYVVFGIPKTSSKHPEKDLDDQDELGNENN